MVNQLFVTPTAYSGTAAADNQEFVPCSLALVLFVDAEAAAAHAC